MRTEAEGEQPVFDSLDEELKKATAVSDKMSRVHSERDVELDHYRQLLSGLQDRWKAVFAQIDLRQRELEQLGRQLGYYRESYDWLIRWIADAKQRQEKIQAVPITDSNTLKEQLAQEKVDCGSDIYRNSTTNSFSDGLCEVWQLNLFPTFQNRNFLRRLRATKTKSMSVNHMLKHTSISSRWVLESLLILHTGASQKLFVYWWMSLCHTGLWTPAGCLQSPGRASHLSLEENQTGFSFWQHHSGGVFLTIL